MRRIHHLHSIMLLLYRVFDKRAAIRWNIYIPLCFYFIGARDAATGLEQLFTFHYASTLSKLKIIRIKPFNQFTFHYASTLSRKAQAVFGTTIEFTFHYASTLSHLTKKRRPPVTANLHSIMLLLYRTCHLPHSWGSFIIYIPLCFYFIRIRFNIQRGRSWFTFHYASTLSTAEQLMHGKSLHLHSIMLLLYPRYNDKFPRTFRIYIPLCFYFIGHDRKFCREYFIFTFHYASTLSAGRQTGTMWEAYLHSIMLLLYQT